MNTAKAERENAEDDANTQLGILHASYSELENRHRACQTYITEGNERKIRENTAHLDDIKREITATQQARAAIAATVTKLHDDVARAGHTKSNIKSNLDYRTEGRTIDEVQAELDEIDIEQAYKARREFNTQANQKEEAETRAQNQVSCFSMALKLIELVANGQRCSDADDRKPQDRRADAQGRLQGCRRPVPRAVD